MIFFRDLHVAPNYKLTWSTLEIIYTIHYLGKKVPNRLQSSGVKNIHEKIVT